MSTLIKESLTSINAELDKLKKVVLDGKREIAYAIKYNGIETVHPYDDNDNTYSTFVQLAELIRKLKASNSMILEFQIPEGELTNYKRTIVLPLYQAAGYAPSSLNEIAKEIIANSPHTLEENWEEKETKEEIEGLDEHIIEDVYGNNCIDGTYIPTMDDIEEYLTEDQQIELLRAMEELGIHTEYSKGSRIAEEGSRDVEANYEYVVNWGDGSDPCEFHNGYSYEQNKAAMWHTYEKSGVYDVSITGNFRRVYTRGDDYGQYLENGEYVRDVDGVILTDQNNYGMRNYLISVISWGNTLLNNMDSAFRGCKNLATIPMYDTSNSFEDVVSFAYCFRRCTSLKEIPFNKNTNKGLFSNCKKVTSFAYVFEGCTGLTAPIPPKLFDGCENVTAINGAFSNTKCSGGIPNGLLNGMTKLSNASEMFSNSLLEGDLSEDLFIDSPNITSIYRLFYNCKGVTGAMKRNFIGGLSKLTDMRQAFYGCSGISSIESDAFYNIKSNNINCRQAFYGCSGIKEIPSGLLEEMSGSGLMLEKMFDRCTGITTIAPTAVATLKAANARGMFGGCSSVTSELPNANSDWSNYDTMEKWFGAFAGTNLANMDTVYKELGGHGERLDPSREVGKIVLQDKTRVEIEDYTYDASNKPIGWVYADVYLDPSKSVPTLGQGQGNKVLTAEGNNHYLFVAVWNDLTKPYCSGQANAEDITTITNTTDYSVGYNTYTYNGDTQTLHATRYNGLACSKALLKFVLEKGYGSNVLKEGYTSYSVVTSLPTDVKDMVSTNIYLMVDENDDNHYNGYKVVGSEMKADEAMDVYLNKLTSDRYQAITHCNTYSANGINSGECHLSDATDLWDMLVEKEWMNKACEKVIAEGGGFSTSNCYPMRDGTWYWASPEYSSTAAWLCYTNYCYVFAHYKWGSPYVRPSLAIAV